MAAVSTVAMWIGQHDGKLIIEWFGWEVSTTPSFFVILLITIIFILYISIKFSIRMIKLPFIIKKKITNARLKKSENAPLPSLAIGGVDTAEKEPSNA